MANNKHNVNKINHSLCADVVIKSHTALMNNQLHSLILVSLLRLMGHVWLHVM